MTRAEPCMGAEFICQFPAWHVSGAVAQEEKLSDAGEERKARGALRVNLTEV